jgi:hypothetical protein
VRAVGITGHGMGAPATHLEALRRFPFDTVLTPYNYRLTQFERYRRDFEALVAATTADDVGLMLIKAIARNHWRLGEDPRYATWYEPLDRQRHIDAAVAFTLARPEVAGVCTAGDVGLVPLFVHAEKAAGLLTMDEIESELSTVAELEPPFVRVAGRAVPDWIEPLLPG